MMNCLVFPTGVDHFFTAEIADCIVGACQALGQGRDFKAGEKVGKATMVAGFIKVPETYKRAQWLLCQLHEWAHSDELQRIRGHG